VPRTSPAGLSLCADAGLLGGDHGRAVGPCPCRTYAPGDHWLHADQHRQPTRADAEWLAEAFTLWGIAVLIVIVTALTRDMTMRAWVYRAIAGLLLAIAALTAVTWLPHSGRLVQGLSSRAYRVRRPTADRERRITHGFAASRAELRRWVCRFRRTSGGLIR
jgi:hypothetical protein